MELFEFLMVLVSIIIGLGIAEVLTGVARVIRFRGSVRRYWIQSVMVATIFLAHLQIWWESWTLQTESAWTFPALLMMLAGPVALFLIAHLLYPETIDGSDLEAYYYDISRPFWILAAVVVVGSTLFRPLIFGQTLFAADNATSFVMLAGFITLATSRRRVLHAILVPTFLVLLLLDVLLLSYLIGGE